ncbi:hypothetical protein DFJ63DRAFT_335314 [Scheffersomyces coipomensis]|uniref:uncharacterized protein n=1 Tax=Scheffersomyces coipomensis TaxID=1788519 RepID=UPI00315D71FA
MDFEMRQSSSPPRNYHNNSYTNNNNHISLNTPIKKINQLSLNSPFQSPSSPILNSSPVYPTLNDIIVKSTPIDFNTNNHNVSSIMTNKGYSQKLTNNVLMELNNRANQLSSSMMLKSPPTTSSNTIKNSAKLNSNRKKRYSGIHRGLYNGMESISSHYSVKTNTVNEDGDVNIVHNIDNNVSPEKQIGMVDGDQEASVKRRRTLNGPDEVLRYIPTFQLSPESSNQSDQLPKEKLIHKPNLTMTSSTIPTLHNTTKDNNNTDNKSSPLRKISPSKKFMNLNALLTGDEEPSEVDMLNGSPNKDKFLKPFPPSNKLRPSSLQMAGVGNVSSQTLHKKSSIPQLQKKASNSSINSNVTLTKKPSIPQLQRKSSIPQLQKKPSIPQLQHKPSIPQLHNKPSIPTLQHKPSIPTLQRKSSIPQLQPAAHITSHNDSRMTSPSRSYSNRSISSVSTTTTTHDKILSKSSKINEPSHYKINPNSKVTIPQPFSLYNKPTISSSQKSLPDNKTNINSSQKSLSKFARFKQQFH